MSENLTGYPSIDKPWMKQYKDKQCLYNNPEQTIYSFIREINVNYMDSYAIVYFGRKISYKRFFVMIEKCRDNLAALGIGEGDIITIHTLAIPQSYILMYALSMLGACANFIYATSTEKDTKDILIRTKSKMYVVLDKIYQKMSDNLIKDTFVENIMLLSFADEMDILHKLFYLCISKNKIVKNNILFWKDFIRMNESKFDKTYDGSLPVAMVYTGGTTGKSKAVEINSHNLNYAAYQCINAGMNYRRGAKILNTLPPFIAYGLTIGVHLPLAAGIRIILEPDSSLEKAGELFAKHKPNYYASGAVQVDNIIHNKKVKKMSLDFIEQIVTGGDALPITQERKINEFLRGHNSDKKVIKGYGMTEITALITVETPNINKEGSVGMPSPLTNVKIIDSDSFEELKYGEVGEICVTSKCIMSQYFNDKNATDEVMKVHKDGNIWLHTGDLGFVDEEGYLTIVGRIKRMILCREGATFHKVFPKIIEEKIETVEGVMAVAVVGKPNI